MYSEYLRERENKEILEDERGFAIYGYNCVPGVDFPHCYLQDVYVRPEWRKRGHASKLADQISAQAKAAGFKVLISSVDCSARGAHESLQVLIAYGMQLFTAHDGAIFFSKEIS